MTRFAVVGSAGVMRPPPAIVAEWTPAVTVLSAIPPITFGRLVGAVGRRLEPQRTSVVHPQIERLVVGGAEKVGRRVRPGIAVELASSVGELAAADATRAVEVDRRCRRCRRRRRQSPRDAVQHVPMDEVRARVRRAAVGGLQLGLGEVATVVVVGVELTCVAGSKASFGIVTAASARSGVATQLEQFRSEAAPPPPDAGRLSVDSSISTPVRPLSCTSLVFTWPSLICFDLTSSSAGSLRRRRRR